MADNGGITFSTLQQQFAYWFQPGTRHGNGFQNVSQEWGQNGEKGIDITMPFHSDVFTPVAGVVKGQHVDSSGLSVWVETAPDKMFYFQHMDATVLQTGQYVQPGDYVGLSGGQNVGGFHPASSANSTGPHIEVGWNWWAPLGPNFNPLPGLQAIAATYAAFQPVPTKMSGSPATNRAQIIQQIVQQLQQLGAPQSQIDAFQSRAAQATDMQLQTLKNNLDQLLAYLKTVPHQNDWSTTVGGWLNTLWIASEIGPTHIPPPFVGPGGQVGAQAPLPGPLGWLQGIINGENNSQASLQNLISGAGTLVNGVLPWLTNPGRVLKLVLGIVVLLIALWIAFRQEIAGTVEHVASFGKDVFG